MKNNSGERYHPLEVAFLEALFMNAALIIRQTSVADYKKNFNYKSITQQHKAYFAGQILPGRSEPAEDRTQSSFTRFWIRQHVDKQVESSGTTHLKARRALQDSGKFKTRRVKILKAMGRHEEATALETETGEQAWQGRILLEMKR